MRNAALTAAVEFVAFLSFLAGAAAVLVLVFAMSSAPARAAEFPGCSTDMECETLEAAHEATTSALLMTSGAILGASVGYAYLSARAFDRKYVQGCIIDSDCEGVAE